ncbi:MAG: hypothetical protein ABRQ39_28745 [Candidatus Eremiobacterota bacterium]
MMMKIGNKSQVTTPKFNTSNKLGDQKNSVTENNYLDLNNIQDDVILSSDRVLTSNLQESDKWFSGPEIRSERIFETLKAVQVHLAKQQLKQMKENEGKEADLQVLTSNLQENEKWFSGPEIISERNFETLKAVHLAKQQLKQMKENEGKEADLMEVIVNVQTSFSDAHGKDSVRGDVDVQASHIDDNPLTEDKIVVTGKIDQSAYNNTEYTKREHDGKIKITYLEKEGLIQKIVKEDVTSTFKTVGNNPETIGTYDFHQHFAFVVDEKDGTITQEHNYLPKNLSGI